MKTIEQLFTIHRAESATAGEHKTGEVAFVSNKSGSNGVIGHVTPSPKDKVFEYAGIVVSALSGFTVQIPPFIARGNAGSGLLVLEPHSPMTMSKLWVIAAYLNKAASWRFNWYHQLTVDRVRQLAIPDDIPDENIHPRIQTLLPFRTARHAIPVLHLEPHTIDTLFIAHRAKSGLFSDYNSGAVAYIGNGLGNNGVVGYVEPFSTDKIFQFQAIVLSAFCEATVQIPPSYTRHIQPPTPYTCTPGLWGSPATRWSNIPAAASSTAGSKSSGQKKR